jgi:hypothetical protein
MHGFLAGLTLLAASIQQGAGENQPANGYDELIAAAQHVRGVGSDTNAIPAMGVDRLKGLVEPNREALRIAREALSKGCTVPPRDLINPGRMTVLISLTQLFNAEGALHEATGRFEEAAESYLDMIALSVALPHGGRLQDATSAVAASVLARQGLMRIRNRLHPDACRRCVLRIEATERAREPLADLLIREDRLRRSSRPILGDRLRTALRMPGPGLGAFSNERFLISREAARVRLLAVDLAIQSFRAERKQEPSKLDELVPGHLAKIPADPFQPRDGSLLAVESRGGVIAYSVGPDRIDDGGRPIVGREEPFARGDLFLAAPNRDAAP